MSSAPPNAFVPCAITAFTATTAVGRGLRALADALWTRRSGLRPDTYARDVVGVPLATWTGTVEGLDDAPLPARWRAVDCRNHRLAWLALAEDGFFDAAVDAVRRHGPSRVAVLIGTSTSTIAASEAAYREHARTGRAPTSLAQHDLHHLHATTAFVQQAVGASGPCATVSTACSSSAKVFAQASRMIAAGVVDAAVVGGVDSLAASTLFGFRSLGLVSSAPCRPFDERRDGISLGEAGGFALLERRGHADAPLLIGYGESSDAHHMSSPHPEGRGARLAIEATLERAGLAGAAVDYINLHGTATPRNDAVEAAVIASLFGADVHADSTKGWTGHTLGAAGIVEAVIALLALRDGRMPGMLDGERPDPACGPQIAFEPAARPIDVALSNAFAFGGNNCVLAFARDAGATTGALVVTASLAARVVGIGAWAPGYAGWPALRAAFVDGAPAATTTVRPVPVLLPSAERRRTPDGVAVALAVAQEAIDDGATRIACAPSSVATVFASAHGELAIVDYLCETLATDPTLVSPTRFHHSVHNAAAGYWTIATGNHAPSTSIAAGEHSFAVGLVEALTQVVADGRPVLLVAFDTPTTGLLKDAVANSALFGVALLLAPPDGNEGPTLTIACDGQQGAAPLPRTSALCALAASSPAARSLALLEALATGQAATVPYPSGATSWSVTLAAPAAA